MIGAVVLGQERIEQLLNEFRRLAGGSSQIRRVARARYLSGTGSGLNQGPQGVPLLAQGLLALVQARSNVS